MDLAREGSLGVTAIACRSTWDGRRWVHWVAPGWRREPELPAVGSSFLRAIVLQNYDECGLNIAAILSGVAC